MDDTTITRRSGCGYSVDHYGLGLPRGGNVKNGIGHKERMYGENLSHR